MSAIKKAKQAMLKYEDFYGGDLIRISDIENCETMKDLSGILDNHESHMESMLADAKSHLNKLRNEYKIYSWEIK